MTFSLWGKSVLWSSGLRCRVVFVRYRPNFRGTCHIYSCSEQNMEAVGPYEMLEFLPTRLRRYKPKRDIEILLRLYLHGG